MNAPISFGEYLELDGLNFSTLKAMALSPRHGTGDEEKSIMTKAKFTHDAYDPDAILRDLERRALPVDPAIPSDETLADIHEQLDILIGAYTIAEDEPCAS